MDTVPHADILLILQLTVAQFFLGWFHLSRSLWQFRRGYDAPPIAFRRITCGRFSAEFDSGSGALRSVAFDGHEVLGGIYATFRDHNWDTLAAQIENLSVSQSDDAVNIQFDATYAQCDTVFVWQGQIRYLDNTLSCRFAGRAETELRRNRLGFCVLHPTICAGSPCTIEQVDGTISRQRFPVWISPNQPFLNVRAITHEFADGMTATVRMTGDTFEMEDQRNWTDASFKTYCTPLAIPFPVALDVGDVVEQEVFVEFSDRTAASDSCQSVDNSGGVACSEKPGSNDRVLLTSDTSPVQIPAIGLGSSSVASALSDAEATSLKRLDVSHIRFDLYLGSSDWRAVLERACQESRQLQVGCEFALFVTEQVDVQLSQLAAAIEGHDVVIARWIMLHSSGRAADASLIKSARTHLDRFGAAIGSGSDAYFAELHRNRPNARDLDFVSYSINPQVHAFDDRSLMETLAVQQTTVESARQFFDDKPIVISPVTLRPRFNPNATGPEPEPAAGELPSQVDPRQKALFGAAWTLGSIVSLSRGHAASVTCYETVGWRGVLAKDAAEVFPLYHIIRDIAEMRREGGPCVPIRSSHPTRVAGIANSRGGRKRILLANLTSEPVDVRLAIDDHVARDGRSRIRILSEETFELAGKAPEEFRKSWTALDSTDHGIDRSLPPYACANIVSEETRS
jgi:D-apionolactonase